MLSVSYAGKNAYSAGKTSGVLKGGASGANSCYVLAHCAPPHHVIHASCRFCVMGPILQSVRSLDTQLQAVDNLCQAQIR